jgi:3-hydroxybutyryl-CoA dehydratase
MTSTLNTAITPPKVGDVATESRVITDEVIRQFAAFSGDMNPVHLDETYAAKTRFKGRIAHGMIALSMISKLAGTKMPGYGTIYLSHNVKFKAPVYVGDTVTAEVRVTNVRGDTPIVALNTTCRNQRGEILLEGDAIVLYEPIPG